VTLCKEAAKAGDDEASRFLGTAYLAGDPVTKDPKEARRWWELAAQQNPALGARRLGEMYANGEGGKADPKKALAQWIAAEKAGDQLACILVADQLFSQISGGRKPGPGRYAFKGGVPTGDIEVAESWYKAALENDPRPDVRQRAQYALAILKSFTTVTATTKKP
jgi:TPR repeat protein